LLQSLCFLWFEIEFRNHILYVLPMYIANNRKDEKTNEYRKLKSSKKKKKILNEKLSPEINSDNVSLGNRKIPFSRILYIEKDDFMENPSSKYFRLTPGKEVRLKFAYFIKCQSVIRDDITGEIVEVRCTYDPETKSGSGFKGRKVKSTIHWVSENEGIKCKVNFYENLLMDESESLKEKWREFINPNSLKKYNTCYIEPFINEYKGGEKFQFIRHGYFCIDTKNTKENQLVFNRIVSLKSSWKK